MGALKLWNGAQWVTPPTRPGPPGPVGPAASDLSLAGEASGDLRGSYPNPRVRREKAGTLLGVQVDRCAGVETNYIAVDSGDYFLKAGVTRLEITFTARVATWWEVVGVIGSLHKIDAAYHYSYLFPTLTPADANAVNARQVIGTQHSTVTTHKHRLARILYSLVPGITYTCNLQFSSSGGSWEYSQSPKTGYIIGKAFAQ